MTAYSTAEGSVFAGEPVECYKFVGSRKTYYYTSHDIAVTLGGNVYAPLSLKRNDPAIGTHEDDGNQMQIET